MEMITVTKKNGNGKVRFSQGLTIKKDLKDLMFLEYPLFCGIVGELEGLLLSLSLFPCACKISLTLKGDTRISGAVETFDAPTYEVVRAVIKEIEKNTKKLNDVFKYSKFYLQIDFKQVIEDNN